MSKHLASLRIALALATLLAPAAAGASVCDSLARPAATLLVPLFRVDLANPLGETTLFAVGNAGAVPTVAHVVLWTNYGLPTVSFDIALAADDLQTVNLRDVLAGVVPPTEPFGLPFCAAPVAGPALDEAGWAAVRAKHSGAPVDGLCWSTDAAGPGIASGFVTIDAANRCAATAPVDLPTEAGYFVDGGTGVASDANVLFGDVFLVDPEQNYAQGMEAVHIQADAARFTGDAVTFYSSFASGSDADDRAPLPTKHRARFLQGGVFDGATELVAWMEPGGSFRQPQPCGALGAGVDGCQYLLVREGDEDGFVAAEKTINPFVEVARTITVDGPELPVSSAFGFLDLESRVTPGCHIIPIGDFPLQSWIAPVYRAEGKFSVGLNATRLGNELCEDEAP